MSNGVHQRPARNLRLWALLTSALLGLLATSAPPASAEQAQPQGDGSSAWQQPVKPGWREDSLARGFVMNQLKGMTLEEKVGQLFVTYAYGDTATTANPADVANNRSAHGVDNAKALIERYHLGGVIYFAWSNNVNNPAQIANLSNGVQEVAAAQRSGIPLLITTDQEQGIVARVGPPATAFPGNMALGAGRSPYDAFVAAQITGRELRALGINQNYAPVADVNVNALNPVIGVRSFGEDPQLVAQLTAAQVLGYQRRDGVAATAKHFPGHGDTAVDSHTGVPLITHTREEWERLDLPPFKAAIAADIDMIMTAHIIVPALDPANDPATLSRPIMTGILREELGYDGVVVTDALGMQGVRDKYGDDRVPVLALKAGVDMLLMPPRIDLAYNAVLNAVRSGEISESRIDESVYRVLRLKFYRGLFRERYVNPEEIGSVVGTPAHYAEAHRITEGTTTLVKNDAGVLPLAPTSRKVLVTGWGVSTTATLAGHIGARGATTDVYETGINPSLTRINTALARAATSEVIVVTTNNAWRPTQAGQQALVKALVATGKPVIVLAVRDPYDIAYFTQAATYVATYSYTGIALESVVKVLFGEVSPAGKLPVTVPVAGQPTTPLYPYGHGLTY
ncbi:MAG TPA: glycoside hydrolase family 3 protein [Micromonosporaceae bacterium]|nr:glycoside hydrolase family 3 protein [Micromonosporaceae bacterium]